jgi:hypothetical protein
VAVDGWTRDRLELAGDREVLTVDGAGSVRLKGNSDGRPVRWWRSPADRSWSSRAAVWSSLQR